MQIPSLGYANLIILAGRKEPGRKSPPCNCHQPGKSILPKTSRMELRRITGIFDKSTGGISIPEKYQANELIALQNPGVDELRNSRPLVAHERENPLPSPSPSRARSALRSGQGTLLNSTRIQEISIYRTVPRIDLKTILVWTGRRNSGEHHLSFSIERANLTYEVPLAPCSTERERARDGLPSYRCGPRTTGWIFPVSRWE